MEEKIYRYSGITALGYSLNDNFKENFEKYSYFYRAYSVF